MRTLREMQIYARLRKRNERARAREEYKARMGFDAYTRSEAEKICRETEKLEKVPYAVRKREDGYYDVDRLTATNSIFE